ncbi:MAG: SPOR domain-containing protein, partial [Paracoccaceae bacterium]
ACEATVADLEFEDFEGAYGARLSDGGNAAGAKRIVNISGAVCSVALIIGLTVWGYKLAVRDVSGVPVMQALGGPMRMAPADPGGDQASNQGLSVNAIAAVGTSSPSAEQVTLAPRAVELQADDTAGLIMASGNAVTVAPLVSGATLNLSGQAAPGTSAIIATETVPVGQDATIITATAGDVELPPTKSAVPPMRPRARPAALTVAPGAKPINVQNVSAPGPATEIDPATLAAGTRLAQLGAFDSPDLARAKFSELQAQFGDLMTGKASVIQAAQSGGRTFYRLRAHGFEGEDDARRFCAALISQNADCIPVAQR